MFAYNSIIIHLAYDSPNGVVADTVVVDTVVVVIVVVNTVVVVTVVVVVIVKVDDVLSEAM